MTADLLVFLQALTAPASAGLPALRGLTLEVFGDEFLTLLDPLAATGLSPRPGAGSTALRLLAGLRRPSAGCMFLEGRDIIAIPPHERGFGVVLHDDPLPAPLRTRELAGFALRQRGLAGAEQRRIANEMLDHVGLPGLGQRRVGQLGPAEARRAALARAITRAVLFTQPLLLLDEPLAGLEGASRAALLHDLRDLRVRFGLTVICAMRDAAEARAVSDRIVLLRDGQLEQVGSVAELYGSPVSRFAATAFGEINQLAGSLVATLADGTARVALAGGGQVEARLPHLATLADGAACQVLVRPEQIAVAAISAAEMGEDAVPGRVAELRDMGDHVQLTVLTEAGESLLVRRPAGAASLALRPGRTVSLAWQPHHATAFPI